MGEKGENCLRKKTSKKQSWHIQMPEAISDVFRHDTCKRLGYFLDKKGSTSLTIIFKGDLYISSRCFSVLNISYNNKKKKKRRKKGRGGGGKKTRVTLLQTTMFNFHNTIAICDSASETSV